MTSISMWEIKVLNTPFLNKKCHRCSNSSFYCSDKFRLNAQKKKIDIWLIYKCSNCDSTYNMRISSRKKAELIDKGLFEKFTANDKETAWEYAFMPSIASNNRVELNYASVEYQVIADLLTLDQLLEERTGIKVFQIMCPFDFKLRISTVLKYCLGLSEREILKIMDGKVISVDGNIWKKKDRVRGFMLLEINLVGLRLIFNGK